MGFSLLLLVSAPQSVHAQQYFNRSELPPLQEKWLAVITCGGNVYDSSNTSLAPVIHCFIGEIDGKLRIYRYGGERVFRGMQVNSLIDDYMGDQIHLHLPDPYILQVTNVNPVFRLTVRIVNRYGDVVYQDSVSQYNTMTVGVTPGKKSHR